VCTLIRRPMKKSSHILSKRPTKCNNGLDISEGIDIESEARPLDQPRIRASRRDMPGQAAGTKGKCKGHAGKQRDRIGACSVPIGRDRAAARLGSLGKRIQIGAFEQRKIGVDDHERPLSRMTNAIELRVQRRISLTPEAHSGIHFRERGRNDDQLLHHRGIYNTFNDMLI
jgi:hypothetical protein